MGSECCDCEAEEKARHVLEVIAERRSIRSFADKPVSLDDLKKLVTAAKWAPTGSDRQQWKYVIINDPDVLKRVVMASPLLKGRPTAAILICFEKARGGEGEIGFPAQNIMLAAYSLGIGSCPIAGFSQTAVRKILGIPEELEPSLLISLGYPTDVPNPWPRRPWSESVFLNSYSNPLGEE